MHLGGVKIWWLIIELMVFDGSLVLNLLQYHLVRLID